MTHALVLFLPPITTTHVEDTNPTQTEDAHATDTDSVPHTGYTAHTAPSPIADAGPETAAQQCL